MYSHSVDECKDRIRHALYLWTMVELGEQIEYIYNNLFM